jgi:hypothetical protein
MTAFGQTLNAGDTVYSPWFPQQAENCVFRADLIDTTGSPTLTISIFHKNVEDTGDGSSNSSFAAMSSAGVASKQATGLKQLVRFKYAATGTGTVLFRMLTPVWYDNARV